MRSEGGFTLVELLVVFAVMALLTGLTPIAYERMRESMQYRDTVRTIQFEMRQARREALDTGREVRFSIDLRQNVFGMREHRQHQVPASLQIRATVADVELNRLDVASIRFLPLGGATGGSIDVVRASGQGVRLRVDWLSGQVSQEALAP